MPEEKLKKELEELKKQKEEYLNGWKRERADFLNYKKEEMERITELIKYANEELILKMLPILDNFEVAARQNFPLENLSGQEKEKVNKFIQGFLQIKQHLKDFLKSQGIEEIKTIEEKFNPQFHESVGEVEGKGEAGLIVEEIQKGYTLFGKVIKPAKVKISK